jgi:hypothetical protein
LSINSTKLRENDKSDKWQPNTIPVAKKKDYLVKNKGFRRKYFANSIKQSDKTVWNTAEVPRESAFPSIGRQGNFEAAKAARRVQRVKEYTPFQENGAVCPMGRIWWQD